MVDAPIALYDAAALRRLEAYACAALGGDAFELMRRAGQSAWRCVLRHWPNAQRIAIVCGPGNNGGDGYVLARHALESGRSVRVLRLVAHLPITELARQACAKYQDSGGVIDTFNGVIAQDELIVDALFGIGLRRAIQGDAAALVAAINAQHAPVLALDVPSGVDSDNGNVPGVAVRATRTLQFMAEHVGLRTGPALDCVGELALASLEIPDQWREACEPVARLLTASHPPRLPARRMRDSHKARQGHVVCIGGDEGFGGAALLCAEAAARGGAGLVSLATRASTAQASLARRPECMARAVEDAAALQPLLSRAEVIAIGPGLGQTPWAQGLMHAVMASDKPMVVDADALNLLAQRPEAKFAQANRVILTPHPGEAARLLDCTVAQIQSQRMDCARQLAMRYNAIVVLKGAGSVIAAPDRAPCIIGAGNPGMAVGGMGDALTGVIAAMRAQGLEAFDAACAGTWLHAVAGDLAAANRSEIGLLPSDLIEHIHLAWPARTSR